MRLNDILKGTQVTAFHGPAGLSVSSLQQDSRAVEKGSLFFAVRGTTQDGHRYIDAAISKGASAVVCETLPDSLTEGIAYIVVPDTAEAMGRIASTYYGDPSSLIELVGITGTNGKTTTVTLL